jgi:hypothetical protein
MQETEDQESLPNSEAHQGKFGYSFFSVTRKLTDMQYGLFLAA